MISRRPGSRFSRRFVQRATVGESAPPGESEFVGLATSEDGYAIIGTWTGAPPSDANYALGGDSPEYIVGVSTGATTRTWQLSGPILDTETVSLSSDLFTDESVTNASSEAGADYTTNLLFDLDARAGLTHTGDGTVITAAADQSGNANNFVEIETGQGPLYRAAIAQMRGLPMIDCANNDALQSTAAGLIAALTGLNLPGTLVMTWCPAGNGNASRVISWGIKNNATNHYVDIASIGNTCNSRTNGTGANSITTNDLDQWQKKPLPATAAWRWTGANIEMLAGQRSVTYDSSAFSHNAAPDTVAIGARLQALSPSYSNGTFRFARLRLYSTALTDAQLRQVGRAMADGYGVPMLGCSPARALSLV